MGRALFLGGKCRKITSVLGGRSLRGEKRVWSTVWAWLQSDEVDKVTLGWGHIVREEIDKHVKQLCALGVRLIHI